MELRRYNIEIAENLPNIHYLCMPKTIFSERCIAFTTRFDEVRHEGYETVMPCDEVAVFNTKAGMSTGYKVAPMLSDSFSIMLVKSGTVKLSVNYSTETLKKNSMAFLTPNMVVSLSDADDDFMMEGVSFMPAYFDDLSAYAPVYNQMISFANENALPIRSLSESEWNVCRRCWGFILTSTRSSCTTTA